jgi:hypothetical protein
MPTHKFTVEILNAAILGFEEQKRRIDSQIAELRAMLDGGTRPTPAATPETPKRKRRKMSAAGRKAIAEAQRKRWAASKKAAVPPKKTLPKRKLSPAGKAALVANLAKARAAKAAKRGKKQ